jgi:ATP-dependent Clp protease adaptor protein ClpS
MSHETQSDIAVEERVKYGEVKRFNVVVHNNEVTSYDEVIFIVSHVFNKSEEESFQIARKVDSEGKGICGTYDGEVADVKLLAVDMAKQYLAERFPHRALHIKALKFTKEEA